jgi:hypothetical protein
MRVHQENWSPLISPAGRDESAPHARNGDGYAMSFIRAHRLARHSRQHFRSDKMPPAVVDAGERGAGLEPRGYSLRAPTDIDGQREN